MMFKKRLKLGIVGAMIVALLAATSINGAASLKVGMVTNSGTIDDKSFNQGTWEGILRAGKEFKVETKYLKPDGTTEADYIKEIGNLYDAGFRLIICPGFPFETAIFKAQDKYQDAKFVLIDGTPHNGDSKAVLKKNTVSILFSEHEAAFIAGVATALQLKEGLVGFIGGMAIPPVQRFNWGFQQGIIYANENFKTKIVIKPENVIYQGTFSNVAAGQQLAAQMFDRGVKAIFCAAGDVGVGSINEAKSRVKSGQNVWIIGVDRDQFSDGIYEANKSVVLTSAMKRVDQAAYAMIKAQLEGEFPGGEILVFNAKSNGVGIPDKNPNLSKEIQAKVAKVVEDLKAGKIVVYDEQRQLIK